MKPLASPFLSAFTYFFPSFNIKSTSPVKLPLVPGGARASCFKAEMKGDEGCGNKARNLPTGVDKMAFKLAEILPPQESFMFSRGACGGLLASSRILTASLYLLSVSDIVIAVLVGAVKFVVEVVFSFVVIVGVVVVVCGGGSGGVTTVVVVVVGSGGVVVFGGGVLNVADRTDVAVVVVVVVAAAAAAAAAAVVVVVVIAVAVVRAVFVVCIVVDVRILLNLNFPLVGQFFFEAAADIVSCSVVAARAASASAIAAATVSLSDVVDAGVVMVAACDPEVVVPVSASALGDTPFSPF